MSEIILEEISTSLGLNPADVNLQASFVQLGGHSLSAALLAAACKKRGFDTPVASILTEASIDSLIRVAQPNNISKPRKTIGLEESTQISPGFISDEDYVTPLMTSSTTSTSMLWSKEERQDGKHTAEFPLKQESPHIESNDVSGISELILPNWRQHLESLTIRLPEKTAGIVNDGPDTVSLLNKEKFGLSDLASSIPLPSAQTPSTNSLESPTGMFKLNPSPGSNMTNANWLTEMQLSLLQGSLNDPRTNFIYYNETYPTESVPRMKKAWFQIVSSEPIFQIQEYHTGADGVDNYIVIRDTSSTSIELNWKEMEAQDEVTYQESKENCENLFDVQSEMDLNHLHLEVQFRVITWRGIKNGKNSNQSTIIWRIHHALIDGFSASLVFRKLRAAKQGVMPTTGPPFSALAGELCILQTSNAQAGNQYWQEHQASLASGTKDLLLPSPDPLETGRLQRRCAEVTTTLHTSPADLFAYAQTMGVTPASILYAAWALVLSNYTDSDATVVGAVMSGRNLSLPYVDSVIGPLINTLPFFIQIDRTKTARELMRETFVRLVRLATYQWTTPVNGFTRDFASALAIQFEMPMTKADDEDLLESPSSWVETDIPLSLMVEAEGTIRIAYQVSRYFSSDVERLASSLGDAVQSLLRPESTVQCCLDSLLTCDDQRMLQTYGNCRSGLTTHSIVKDDLVTLFERAVTETPNGIALEKGGVRMTYRELDVLADLMAEELRIESQQVVCLHADKSINWIVGIWAILKAGGVYCALDPSLPADLRDQVYVSGGAKLFLSPSTAALASKPRSAVGTFDIEQFITDIKEVEIPQQHRKRPRPSRLAYLCFTSGSTGKPKGVMCSHEGLVAFQRDLEVRLFAQPGRRISQFMSVAFDGSIHEIFSALCYGATLVLSCSGDPFEPVRTVDSAILTPSIAAVLDPASFPTLSAVYLVGERVPQAVADRWGAATALYNMYGPTEGTGGATITRLLPGRPVTIGRPNPSSRIYILDSHQFRVPPGVVGEIYLAGVQIARGYIGRPDETAARFLPDTISAGLEEQMYRTGDRGYWNCDGDIVFLGRNDRQVKLRGFRIDLEDLEIRMHAAFASTKAVAVAVSRNSDGTQGDSLVALVRPATVDITGFRKSIARAVPVHAMPRYIFPVDDFPVTKVGKLDYAAIATYGRLHTAQSAGAGSPTLTKLRGLTERQLEVAWRMVLGLPEHHDISEDISNGLVSIDAASSFIALGGHSLTQLRLANQLTRIFNTRVPVRVVIECDNLRTMAIAIDRLKERSEQQLEKVEAERCLGENELSPIELEWWQKYDLDASSSAFNVSMAGTFKPEAVDRMRLIAAWNIVLAEHRILRCRYVSHKRKVTRVYAPNPPQVQRVHEIDIWSEINRPFQLTDGPPVRVFVTDSQMVITLSHIVCDLTTMNLLLGQVSALYQGNPMPVIQTYMDCTSWCKKAPPCYLDHWDTVFPDARLKESCRPSPKSRSRYGGKSLIFSVKTPIWHRMQQFTTARNITYQQLSLAAVALALSFTNDEVDITLGLPYINRNSEADIETVGLFLEPLPVRIKYESSAESERTAGASYLDVVQKASREALGFAVPWLQLLHHLGITPDYPNHPLFETMVTFHDETNAPAAAVSAGIPGIEPRVLWTEGAKFQLMCEFTALSTNRLLLRLEHDTDCFCEAEIWRVENCIDIALGGLVEGQSFEQILRRLRGEVGGEPSPERLERDLFAKEVSVLR